MTPPPPLSFAPGEPIPTFAGIVHYLAATFTSEDGSGRRAHAALYRDPAVCARVLRLANSPYYGRSGEVGDPATALSVVGLPAVQAMALGAPSLALWETARPPEAISALWTHSYLTAVCARFLADSMGNARPELPPPARIQAAALLHDLGKVLHLGRDPEGYSALLADTRGDAALEMEELERYGATHAETGRRAAEAWRLPPLFSAAAGLVGRPGAARAEYRVALDLIGAAHDIVIHQCARTAPAWIPLAVLDQAVSRMGQGRSKAEALYRALCGPAPVEGRAALKERDVQWR